MLRKFRVSVDGRAYDVVVEEIAEDSHALALPAAPVASAAPVAAAAPAKPVVRPVQRSGGGAAEVAPLAGVVVSVDVAMGQHVAAGDLIAVIEAMKMKTDVVAKGAGAVASIAVKVGDVVDAGDELLTLA